MNFPSLKGKIVGLDTETNGLRPYLGDKIFGVSVALEGGWSGYFDVRTTPNVFRWLRDELPKAEIIIGHHIKFDAHFLANEGVEYLDVPWHCTMVTDTLCYEHHHEYSLEAVAQRRLGRGKSTEMIDKWMEISGAKNKKEAMATLSKAPEWLVRPYAITDAELLLPIYFHQLQDIMDQDLQKVYNLEVELQPVLFDMERNGVKCDVQAAHDSIPMLTEIVDSSEKELNDLVGFKMNVNSTPQVRKIFAPEKIGKYQFKLSDGTLCWQTDAGNPSIDQHVLKEMTHPAAALIRKVRKVKKLRDTFVKGHILSNIDANGYVHTTFNATRNDADAGTVTGRLCIAQGQRVSTPRGQVPIEDIIIGEYVYCYDNQLNVRLKRVTNKFQTGRKECVKLKWVSSSRTRGDNSGELICTPEHRIRLKDGSYVMAKDINNGTKVLHVRRRTHESGQYKKLRVRVYGTDRYCEPEQTIIKRDVFGIADEDRKQFHLHHKDRNTTNNNIENFELKTASEHTSEHSSELWEQSDYKKKGIKNLNVARGLINHARGNQHRGYKTVGKIKLLKAISLGKGTIQGAAAILGLNRDTVSVKCREAGIDLHMVLVRYDGKGKYISKGRLSRSHTPGVTRKRWNKLDVANNLSIGHAKVDKVFLSHGLERNHQLYRATLAGVFDVWDLSIEDECNFIVEEICVHNSSTDPAMQQINGRDKDTSKILRSMFIVEEGYDWLGKDFSSADFRIASHYLNDANMVQAYNDNPDTDFHQFVADITGIPRSPEYAGGPSSKTLNLSMAFGAGAGKVASQMKMPFTVEEWNGRMTLRAGPEATAVINSYHRKFPVFKRFAKNAADVAKDRGYIMSLMGRKLRFIDGSYHKAAGYLFQSGCAESMKVALVRTWKLIRNTDYKLFLTVHDEVGIKAPIDGTLDDEIHRVYTDFKSEEAYFKLRVPMTASSNRGRNWYESH